MSISEAVREVSKRYRNGEMVTGYALVNSISWVLFRENGSRPMAQTILRRVRESGLWIGINKYDPRNEKHIASLYMKRNSL